MSIYELLNRIIINEKYSLSSDLFIESEFGNLQLVIKKN